MLCFACVAGEFVRLAELPCLVDLVFVGNPLEEKHSAEGTWMDEATKRLPNLKKLDGTSVSEQERIIVPSCSPQLISSSALFRNSGHQAGSG